MSSQETKPSTTTTMQIGPALAGWLLPGLGQMILGHKKRGVILFLAVYGLFFSGLMVGGIDVIDPLQGRLWFIGQCFVGPPAPALGYTHVEWLRGEVDGKPVYIIPDPPEEGQAPPKFTKSVGRVHELGQLYCTMAGMLNLLVILDALYRPHRKRSDRADPNGGRLVQRVGTTP